MNFPTPHPLCDRASSFPRARARRGVVATEYILLTAAILFAGVMALPLVRDWILSFGELLAYFVESPVLIFG